VLGGGQESVDFLGRDQAASAHLDGPNLTLADQLIHGRAAKADDLSKGVRVVGPWRGLGVRHAVSLHLANCMTYR
jgi:hypothetical protein